MWSSRRQKVFDYYAVTVMIGENPYTLVLFDTAGTRTIVLSCSYLTNWVHRPG